MDTFIQLTLNGLTLGSVYALIALGYSLVYGILKLLNFAHGDVFMVGSFIGFGVLQLLGGSTDPVVPVWLLLVAITLAAMAGCAVLGVAIERFAYRPLRDAPRIAPLISALGVSFFLAYSMQLLFGAEQRDYDAFAIDNGALFFKGFDIGNVRVPLLRIIIIVAAFVLMALLWVLATRTKTGKAMQATSYDREAAAMMGIDIDRVIVFAFVLGSALAGAAGVLFALRAPTFPSIGFLAGPQGLHGRGDRRHRLDPGGDGRRPDPRLRGGVHPGLHLDEVVRPARLRDPHPVHAVPPAGPARQGRHQEGVASVEPDRLGRPLAAARRRRRGERRRGPTSPAVGRDEWVARHGERRADRGGVLGTIEQRLQVVPWWAWLALFVGIICLAPGRLRERLRPPGRVQHGRLHAARARAQLVVGWGGLLDLGYVAFFGVGAYTYALLSSDKYDIHLPTLARDPARGDRRRRSSGSSSACRRDGSRATTSRS